MRLCLGVLVSAMRRPRVLLSGDSEDNLLPSTHARDVTLTPIERFPAHSLADWALGRATVFWRIWPAVLILTLFSACVVAISLRTKYVLSVPPVLLTVLGVIIGFVISYRAMTGYDRYWMGQQCWTDVIRTTRTMSRLVWYHVPPRLSPSDPASAHQAAVNKQGATTPEEKQVMAEKRLVLDMIEGFCVALKHHLRGEMGIYYEDLYPLVEPLHPKRKHTHAHAKADNADFESSSALGLPNSASSKSPQSLATAVDSHEARSITTGKRRESRSIVKEGAHSISRDLSPSSVKSCHSDSRDTSIDFSRHPALQPSQAHRPYGLRALFSKMSLSLIPGMTFLRALGNSLWGRCCRRGTAEQDPLSSSKARDESVKHRPQVAGGAKAHNIPLGILGRLSDWVCVLENRGSTSGSTIGGLLGCISAFETSLAAAEQILTTPLPFIFSVHINTVWVYLCFLPFQLLNEFHWYTIPGTTIAAFIYLGLVAAGEELEQPFGYEDNDLDLDLMCQVIVHEDLERLRHASCHSFSDGGKSIVATAAQRIPIDKGEPEDNLLGFLE